MYSEILLKTHLLDEADCRLLASGKNNTHHYIPFNSILDAYGISCKNDCRDQMPIREFGPRSPMLRSLQSDKSHFLYRKKVFTLILVVDLAEETQDNIDCYY